MRETFCMGCGGEMPWPTEPRKVFGVDTDTQLIAHFEWIKCGNWGDYYLRAYEAAIELLFREAVSGALNAEYAVLPLCFLWRHVIELQLKSTIDVARDLWLDGPPKKRGHRLDLLWKDLKQYILPLGPGGSPEPKNVEAMIAEIQQIDPSADGFRYSRSMQNERTLEGMPSKVDLIALHESMHSLSNFLGGVEAALANRLEFFQEQEDESGRAIPIEEKRAARIAYMKLHDHFEG